jgi:hypothetical protein
MRRSAVLSGFALVLALAFATSGSTSPGAPVLRSVTTADGHLVVTFTLGQDEAPGRVLVATSPAGLSHRVAAPGVKLREAMHASSDPTTGLTHWRTRKSLPAGTYFVEVSGVQTLGITDCRPRRPDCLMRWSNMRRVVIR